jgi:hypothetical protein
MLRLKVNLETASLFPILAKTFLLGSPLAMFIMVALSQGDHSFGDGVPSSQGVLPFNIEVISVSLNVVDVLLGLGLQLQAILKLKF